MAEQHEPGEKVQVSGIYKVGKEGDGGSGFEGTCVGGEYFPPTRNGRGAHYELVHGATHSHKHSELGRGDKQVSTGRKTASSLEGQRLETPAAAACHRPCWRDRREEHVR